MCKTRLVDDIKLDRAYQTWKLRSFQRKTYREIAEILGVSATTIHTDLEKMRKYMCEKYADEAREAIEEQEFELECLYKNAKERLAATGEVEFLNAGLKCLADKRKLWGLDKPAKSSVEVNTKRSNVLFFVPGADESENNEVNNE